MRASFLHGKISASSTLTLAHPSTTSPIALHPLRQLRERQDRRAEATRKAQQLGELRQQLVEFEKREGTLPSLIVHHQLDLMLALGARRTYEKARQEAIMSDDQAFAYATSALVDSHLKSYAERHPAAALAEITREEEEITHLFRQIFQLDATARNRLVVTLSRCKTLHGHISELA